MLSTKNMITGMLTAVLALTAHLLAAQECDPTSNVFIDDQRTEAITCPGDGKPDLLYFRTDANAAPYGFAVTDQNNRVLSVLTEQYVYDFDQLPAGTYRVWGFSFKGRLRNIIGQDITSARITTFCFFLSQNYLTVNLDIPDGGRVALPSGATTKYVCPGDGTPDVVSFATSSAGTAYTFVVTDETNKVTAILPGNNYDFDDGGDGISRVWGLAYRGDLNLQVGDILGSASLASDCAGLSANFVTVIRSTPQAEDVSLTGGATEAAVCAGDAELDILDFINQSDKDVPFAYIITDEQNNIIDFAIGPGIDFNGAAAGVCRVWGLAYTGNIIAQSGQNAATATLSDGCFDLSDNFVTVTKTVLDAGQVSFEDGSLKTYTCPGDGNPDVLAFTNNLETSTSYAYIITDDQNNILMQAEGSQADFDDAQPGICRVFGVVYTGTLNVNLGQNILESNLSIGGCFDLSNNYLEVVREVPDGGRIDLAGGNNRMVICPGDEKPDLVNFIISSQSDSPYVLLVTDENGVIQNITTEKALDFDGESVGTSRIYGLAYTGQLNIQVGDNINAGMFSDDCYDLTGNFVEIIRAQPDGGSVAMPDGQTRRYTCPGDGVADLVRFVNTGNAQTTYAYLITDENNNILAVVSGNSFDFDTAQPGICRVWGLSYTGTLSAQVGDNAATTALSSDCFELSDNYIEVIRSKPDGGLVNLSQGGTVAYVCPGDESADVLHFSSTGASNTPFVFLLTDDQDNILSVVAADSFNFNTAVPGTCRVYGLAYTGTLTAEAGQPAGGVALSSDCYDLSNNYLEINRFQPDGGQVSMPDGETVRYTCPGDGLPDLVEFQAAGASHSKYVFIITDDQNVVLEIAPGNFFNFENAPEGTCRVWGVAYTGNLSVMAGDTASTAALSDDCYDLSGNFIEIRRYQPEAGNVATAGGEISVQVCLGDPGADLVSFANAGASPSKYAYVITDEQDRILSVSTSPMIDFSGADPGICHVWGLSYTGNLTAPAGEDVREVDLSDECYDLSGNFVTVNRQLVDGGSIATKEGTVLRYVCETSGANSVVNILHESAATAAAYQFVLTDNQNVILSFINADSIDFKDSTAGTYRIWGLSYTGNLTAVQGDTANIASLSTECFDLSNNFIRVVVGTPDGGRVATADGDTAVTLCVMDGMPDLVFLGNNSGARVAYGYLVTDESNNILQVVSGNLIDLDGAEPGICRIWGISYTGILLAEAGQNAAEAMLSDDCFDLSDNFIEVNRQQVEGGELALPRGGTQAYTCPGDGVPDFVGFFANGAGAGNYQYVLTNEDNEILEIINGNLYDFEASGEGVSRVWGVNFTGNFSGMVGADVKTATLSDACYEISKNFLEIVRALPEAGSIATSEGLTSLALVVGDGVPDVVTFAATGASKAGLRYIVTDNNNVVLALPDGNTVNFEGAGPGTCRVYSFSYTGNFTAAVGDTVGVSQLATGCNDLSDNFVELIRSAPFTGGSDNQLLASVLGITPNPYRNGALTVQYRQEAAEIDGQLRVLDNQGREVYRQSVSLVKGYNQWQIDGLQLAPGLYHVQLQTGEGLTSTRLIKQ